jgi:LacI family gluconate utilization system Gnt-I transcriptional repressor
MARSNVPCVHLMDLPNEIELNQASPLNSIEQMTSPYCVGFRQTDAGEAMTQHLIAKGKKRIVFAAAQLDPRVMQRLNGWRKALKVNQLYDTTLEWLNPAPSSLALGGLMFEQIMKQSPAVDAIFFCNDDLAQGALLAAMRLNIDVPNRVAIAGFNDLTGSDQMWPPLTTVRTPRAQVGEAAAQMLLQLIQGEEPVQAQVDLGFEIIERQST